MKEKQQYYIESVKDYLVSKELFNLLKDEKYDMLVTSPQPKLEVLSNYYQSDSYISHTDSKNTFTDRLYQLVKKYTIAKKVKLINELVESNLNKKSILDIGCGTGDFLTACKKKNWDVVGVEPNENAKSIAEKKLDQKINSRISKLGLQQFDVISMWHVLEHIPNLKEYIIELKKKLKPKGILIVAVPNYKSYDAKHYKNFWAAFDVPRHLWHFSKTSIKLLFGEVGMKVTKTIPMKFDSFYVSLLSEKYKHGKNRFVKSFYIGLKSNLSAISTNEYSSHIYIIKNE